MAMAKKVNKLINSEPRISANPPQKIYVWLKVVKFSKQPQISAPSKVQKLNKLPRAIYSNKYGTCLCQVDRLLWYYIRALKSLQGIFAGYLHKLAI